MRRGTPAWLLAGGLAASLPEGSAGTSSRSAGEH
jgi:hypothetical protein